MPVRYGFSHGFHRVPVRFPPISYIFVRSSANERLWKTSHVGYLLCVANRSGSQFSGFIYTCNPVLARLDVN